jgi:aspartate kinase
MENAIVSAVVHDVSEAKVTITGVPDTPGVAARVFRALADRGINVDMIVQNVSVHSEHGHPVTDISFTVPADDVGAATEVTEGLRAEIDAEGVVTDPLIGKVSLVGAGMKSNPGVAATVFETLATAGINIEMISTSAIRISCIVHEDEVERAVQELHTAFGLDG